MTTARLGKPAIMRSLAIACVFAMTVTAVLWWTLSGATERQVTAYFSSGVGIYPGGEVRILGVPVGSVDEVHPEGKTVRVSMSLDREVDVPADAKAVQVSPSVVSDRYVQLAPVYRGGPTMEDGAVIPRERTATPVELDQVYRSLNDLTKTLGPNGANADGALSDLLNSSAKNLDGNGQALADTIRNLGKAGTTLSGNSEELFGTLDQLQKFTSMLKENDHQVRQFNTQMRDVSRFMAEDREDLSQSLAELAVALGKVEKFVRDNREDLKSNVDQLNTVSRTLVQQKKALNESLTTAPLALGNLQNAYNAASGTLDTRAVINELDQPPLVSVCKLVDQGNPVDLPVELNDLCGQLQPVIDGVAPLPTPAETISSLQRGELPPLPLPLQTDDGVQAPLEGGGR